MGKNTHREELRSSEQWKQGNTCSRSPKEPAFEQVFLCLLNSAAHVTQENRLVMINKRLGENTARSA